MKKLAVLAVPVVLALLLMVGACNTTPTSNITTTTNGNWEATLNGGTGASSLMNFVVTFSLTAYTGQSSQALDITGFSFFNAGGCFTPGEDQQSVSGSATLSTASTGAVTGTVNLTISAGNGTQLSLVNGSLTGTSNGTTTTTGTLSDGVIVGTWTITPGTGVSGCTTPSNPTFVMCQGAATCTIP
jgi:hypothetical protein